MYTICLSVGLPPSWGTGLVPPGVAIRCPHRLLVPVLGVCWRVAPIGVPEVWGELKGFSSFLARCRLCNPMGGGMGIPNPGVSAASFNLRVRARLGPVTASTSLGQNGSRSSLMLRMRRGVPTQNFVKNRSCAQLFVFTATSWNFQKISLE